MPRPCATVGGETGEVFSEECQSYRFSTVAGRISFKSYELIGYFSGLAAGEVVVLSAAWEAFFIPSDGRKERESGPVYFPISSTVLFATISSFFRGVSTP